MYMYARVVRWTERLAVATRVPIENAALITLTAAGVSYISHSIHSLATQ